MSLRMRYFYNVGVYIYGYNDSNESLFSIPSEQIYIEAIKLKALINYLRIVPQKAESV